MNFLVVPLADLEKGPKEKSWTLDEQWLNQALGDTDARSRGDGRLDAMLTKNGVRVIIRGHIVAPLSMPCARTLEPVDVHVETDLLLVLSPAKVSQPAVASRSRRKSTAEPAVTKAGKGPKVGAGHVAKEREISAEEAAEDVYTGTDIVLDEFVREYIILELPMMPLRSDLREQDKPAIPAPPVEAEAETGRHIDPRLAPLMELADRMKHETKE